MELDLVITLKLGRNSKDMGLDTSKKMGQSNAETLMATPPPPPHSLEAENLKRSKVVGETTAETLNLLSASICPEIEHIRSELVGIKPVSDNFTTRQYHVLAVDDSRFDRRVVEKLLKISSYKVTTVSSALKALEVLGLSENSPSPSKNLDIDLIITDYCMPDMTGYDLLRKVKAQTSALRDTPVVIMSSENDTNRIRSCLSEGAEEFIIKPVQLSDIKRLRAHIRAASSLSHSTQSTTESSGSSSGKRKASEFHHETVEVTSSERRPRLKLIVSN